MIGRRYVRANIYAWPGHWDYQRMKTEVKSFEFSLLCPKFLLVRTKRLKMNFGLGWEAESLRIWGRLQNTWTEIISILFTCTQSYLTLWDSMDYCLPGSPVHVISQARILEWVAILSLRGASLLKYWTCISCFGKQFLYHWVTREVHIIYTYMLLIWITCLEKSILSVCVVLYIFRLWLTQLPNLC